MELVRRAQAHPPASAGAEAVCELYNRYHNRIFRYLWSRLSDRQQAEDLTGEVFIHMLHGLPRYRPTEAVFGAWLFRIARNLLYDQYRKVGNRQEISLDQVQHMGSQAGDPAEGVEERLFIERVKGGLHALQPAHQEVIILRFLAGLSLQEVADILGKTVGAVKIIQHRGLNDLRSILGSEASEAEHASG
jgi:RNA polymerase sigma-70 factor (ECF subfamily)